MSQESFCSHGSAHRACPIFKKMKHEEPLWISILLLMWILFIILSIVFKWMQ